MAPLSSAAESLLIQCASGCAREPVDISAATELDLLGLVEWERGVGGGERLAATEEGRELATILNEQCHWCGMVLDETVPPCDCAAERSGYDPEHGEGWPGGVP